MNSRLSSIRKPQQLETIEELSQLTVDLAMAWHLQYFTPLFVRNVATALLAKVNQVHFRLHSERFRIANDLLAIITATEGLAAEEMLGPAQKTK